MSVTLQLTGGLGNQMFSYVAMKALGKKNDSNFRIDGRPLFRITGRNPDLFDFMLEEEVRLKGSRINAIQQHFDALAWKQDKISKATGRYQSPVLGRDSDTSSILSSKYLRGFFQSRVYADCINPDELKKYFSLRIPSTKFSDFKGYLEGNAIVALHIRRGDYRNHADHFGLLSLNYYRDAIEIIQSQQTISDIWIFSDEIPATKMLADSLGGINVTYISKFDFSPAETLSLMSSSKNLIIANSTFSWWAGYLSEKSRVYAPQTWFKEKSAWLFPDNLLPSTWQLVPSKWEF